MTKVEPNRRVSKCCAHIIFQRDWWADVLSGKFSLYLFESLFFLVLFVASIFQFNPDDQSNLSERGLRKKRMISGELRNIKYVYYFRNSSVFHEGNTKQISTMTVTLYLIKLIDVRKNTNIGFYTIKEHGILYKISS